ncbi:MAG: hypothetical protein IKX28_01160 [Bacteroidales bacterium]|nr:hypothetical protein [Bacteroidales bacterium]
MKTSFNQYFTIFLCLVVLLLPARGLMAQRIPDMQGITFQKGKLYLNDSVLKKGDASDYLSASLAQQYGRALTTEKVGGVLMEVGGGVALISGITWAASAAKFRKSGSDMVPPSVMYGMFGTTAGVLVGTGGLVAYLVGRNKVKRVYKTHCAGANVSTIELDLGYTPSGMGLAILF